MAEANLLKPQKPVRQSNFELLRIVLMLIIIAHHLRGYSGLLKIEDFPMMSRLLLFSIGRGGKMGVNGFVLISGYFLCTSRAGFQPKRLLKLWLQIFFYSAGIFALAAALGWKLPSPETSLRLLMPVTGQTYWFATTYFFLFLFSPFLNMLIRSLGRRQYQQLLLIIFVLFSVIPTFRRTFYPVPNIVWFVSLYFIAGYIRLHPSPWFEKKWPALGLFALSSFFIGVRIPFLQAFFPTSLAPQNTLPVFLSALGLFLFFKNLDIKGSRAINLVASGTFGVYLFHEHYLLRPKIWREWFSLHAYYGRPLAFFGLALLVVAAVFLLGLAIDLLRQYVLERPLFNLIEASNSNKRRDPHD